MIEQFEKIGISFDDDYKKLIDDYVDFFNQYNQNVNLISSNDMAVFWEKHLFDSLALNLFFTKYSIKKDIKLLDIGTGGGFPSVPLALTFAEMKVFALDSINKKIAFINQVKEKFELDNLQTICSRVEDLPQKYRNSFDIVTSRAMAELRIILECAIPYVKKGGYFVAYKSIKADEEIKNAQNALKKLNAKIVDTIEYELPIQEKNKRVFIVAKKEKDTDSIYPRKNGLIKKKPL